MPNKRLRSFVLIFAAGLAFLALNVSAQTPAISYTSGGLFAASGAYTYGWAFTISSARTATALGVRDASFGTTSGSGGADGLASGHQISI